MQPRIARHKNLLLMLHSRLTWPEWQIGGFSTIQMLLFRVISRRLRVPNRTLTPSLSHPMGEGEPVQALVPSHHPRAAFRACRALERWLIRFFTSSPNSAKL